MPRNDVWLVDHDLRETATKLKEKFPERLGHIDEARILFVRLKESRVSWYGKVWRVTPPFTLLIHGFEGIGIQIPDGFSIDFIVAINDNQVTGLLIPPAIEQIVLAHELFHIKDEKLLRHDIEDFRWVLEEFGLNWQDKRDANWSIV